MAGLTGIRIRRFAGMGRVGGVKPLHMEAERERGINRLADATEAELDIGRIVSMLGESRY